VKKFNLLMMLAGLTAAFGGSGSMVVDRNSKAGGQVFDLVDLQNASASKRVMRLERGSQPEHRKARRFDRATTRARKAKNRYGNNIDARGKLVRN